MFEDLTTNWLDIISEYDKNQKEKFTYFLDQDVTIYPKTKNIFKCFNYFDIENTKIVILGQDPYHGPNQATGLCFDINDNCKYPPSLRNISKVLGKKPDFNSWAEQGVLLLNTSLTVIEKTPGSHIKYWKPFTKYIITKINQICNNVTFILWGAHALKHIEYIDLKKHNIFISSHPSPLSCFKNLKEHPSFMTSDIFNKIECIDW